MDKYNSTIIDEERKRGQPLGPCQVIVGYLKSYLGNQKADLAK